MHDLLAAATDELGFRHFALLHHASLLEPAPHLIRLDNYPAEWVQELIDDELCRDDPVHLASREASCRFEWTQIDRLISVGPKQKQILKRSRRFGIGDGLTVPINLPGEPSGSCSFAVRFGTSLPRQRLSCAELIGSHAFAAARRLTATRRSRPHLSRREIECLRLIAAGKTDWEAARILGISVETARQYVKHARAVYNVVSRGQLIALAVCDGWLRIDDIYHCYRRI